MSTLTELQSNASSEPAEERKKLDSVSFDQFLDEQDPLGKGNGVFDLNGVTLVTPSALIQMAAACSTLSMAGIEPIVRSASDSVRSYLYRSGFVSVLRGVARIDPEISESRAKWFEHMRGSNPMLLEVTRLEGGESLSDLLDRIVWVLRFRLKYCKHDAFDVTTAISEICQNAFDHNADTAGFVAMQVYGKADRRFLEIAVSDCGVGLAETLRRNQKNGAIRNDLDAIQAATRLGISEHDDPTRGTGLYHLLEITYRHEGAVQIKSGGSKVRYRMDKRAGWAFRVSAAPGVHVALTLPAKTAGKAAA